MASAAAATKIEQKTPATRDTIAVGTADSMDKYMRLMSAPSVFALKPASLLESNVHIVTEMMQ